MRSAKQSGSWPRRRVFLFGILFAIFVYTQLPSILLRSSPPLVRSVASSAPAAAANRTGELPLADIHWHTFSGAFNVPFKIALPDPASDHNTRVILTNVYEDALGDVFRVLLAGRCTQHTPVLDIGANLGIFTATSAAFGCPVVSVEAQTRLVPYIQHTVAANAPAWRDARVEVLNVAVYDAPGSLSIAYYDATRSGWLSMAMDKESLSTCSATPGCRLETVPVVTTAQLVTRDFALVKIDVDGPEAVITKALLPALRMHHVESILIEVCPEGWRDMIPRAEGVGVLRQLMDEFNYDLIILNQIDFGSYKSGFLSRLARLEGVFRPRAYVVPPALLDELFEDSTTAINCKNVVFTSVRDLLQRFESAGGLLVPPQV